MLDTYCGEKRERHLNGNQIPIDSFRQRAEALWEAAVATYTYTHTYAYFTFKHITLCRRTRRHIRPPTCTTYAHSHADKHAHSYVIHKTWNTMVTTWHTPVLVFNLRISFPSAAMTSSDQMQNSEWLQTDRQTDRPHRRLQSKAKLLIHRSRNLFLSSLNTAHFSAFQSSLDERTNQIKPHSFKNSPKYSNCLNSSYPLSSP